MPVLFTRARHAALPSTVLPADALESLPEWEGYGEPSTDSEALRGALELETAAEAAELVSQAPQAGPKTSKSAASPQAGAPEPKTSAPVGADPKE